MIGTKWIFKNKYDEYGFIMRNKVRLVAQGYSQIKGIDFERRGVDRILFIHWTKSKLLMA